MTDLDLPDVNVLVALLHPQHAFHRLAGDWFAATDRFCTTPLTSAGFLRVALNPTVMGAVLSAADVLASLRSLEGDARWELLADDTALTRPVIDLSGIVGPKQVTDLDLVNLVAQAKGRLITLDRKIKPTLLPNEQQLVRCLL
ncbi:MAG: hypothetical protein FWD83_01640 [Promicromonosporaceae bacterium]|nr:hypothetical protein [Promicromonosporaceae bacterium]